MTDSYTQANPVAVSLACEECQVTLSGDNVPDALREMFEERHAHVSISVEADE